MAMSEVSRKLVQRPMTMSELPKDLVEEILCRVPAIALKRLRPTCKTWNRLFKDDKSFARKHYDKAAKEVLPLMLLTKKFRICQMSINLHGSVLPSVEVQNELSLVPPHPHSNNNSARFQIDQVIHCDGLLLCIPDDESRVVVWNPLTSQTKWIETGYRSKIGLSFVLGYYYDNKSCIKRYRMLSFTRDNEESRIYDFDSDSWRILVDVVPGGAVGYTDHIVSLQGNAYWFARDQINRQTGVSLLGFDFSTEKSSGLVSLPYQYRRYYIASLSVVGEDKLSVLLRHKITSETEIWVTNRIDEMTKVVSWSKVLALDLSPALQISEFGSFLLDEDKKSIVCCDRCVDMEGENKYIHMIYIVGEDNKVTQVGCGPCGDITYYGYWPAVLSYVPSLVRI